MYLSRRLILFFDFGRRAWIHWRFDCTALVRRLGVAGHESGHDGIRRLWKSAGCWDRGHGRHTGRYQYRCRYRFNAGNRDYAAAHQLRRLTDADADGAGHSIKYFPLCEVKGMRVVLTGGGTGAYYPPLPLQDNVKRKIRKRSFIYRRYAGSRKQACTPGEVAV